MTQVTIEGDRLCADSLCVRDPELVRFVAEHEDADRPALVERALRVGLIALANAGVTVNVDAVQREFAALLERMDRSNEAASEALTTTLRDNFADADGRLPRTLDRFLGERGELRRLTAELFDPERRDSAIGRIRTLLGTYFDGDGALLAQLLDPAREGSPLHGFRDEMREGLERVAERLSNLEAARTARAEERARGTAKGGDFEDHVGHRLAPLARCWGDLLEHTGTTVGAGVRAKTGDYVLQLDPDAGRRGPRRHRGEGSPPRPDRARPGARRRPAQPWCRGRGRRLRPRPGAGGVRPAHPPRPGRHLRARPR